MVAFTAIRGDASKSRSAGQPSLPGNDQKAGRQARRQGGRVEACPAYRRQANRQPLRDRLGGGCRRAPVPPSCCDRREVRRAMRPCHRRCRTPRRTAAHSEPRGSHVPAWQRLGAANHCVEAGRGCDQPADVEQRTQSVSAEREVHTGTFRRAQSKIGRSRALCKPYASRRGRRVPARAREGCQNSVSSGRDEVVLVHQPAKSIPSLNRRTRGRW
jgi:hypothetical protein